MDAKTIRGDPTKGLFIDMLTRDISLIPAIVDLVDNSTDGARRIRGTGDFKGLWVRLEVDEQRFMISDNCGGMPVEIARLYAFRFGRDPEAEQTKHSVGQFGVGMKRAIFKMGEKFKVESKTAHSQFVVEHDIRKWAEKPDDWDFRFKSLRDEGVVESKRGTVIQVTALKNDVAASFRNPNWVTELKMELRTRLQESISSGLTVTLNGIPVTADPLKLLNDQRLVPAFKEIVFDHFGTPVTVRIWCGLGPSEDATVAGWHVFCNGRLLLEADQSETTGWGTTAGARIPRFHPQYNHFRGYVFFDSDDAGLLPWNTTKTGIDIDSSVYRATRMKMGILARPVISFLNDLKSEKERRKKKEMDDPGPLESLVAGSKATSYKEVGNREAFVVSATTKPSPAPAKTTVQYKVSLERMNAVKKKLKVRHNTEVGLQTFEYFYNTEVEE